MSTSTARSKTEDGESNQVPQLRCGTGSTIPRAASPAPPASRALRFASPPPPPGGGGGGGHDP